MHSVFFTHPVTGSNEGEKLQKTRGAFDQRFWRTAEWRHYAVGVLLALISICARVILAPYWGDKMQFGLPIFPVVFIAYVGGFWPGMATTALGLIGCYIFVGMPQSHYQAAQDDLIPKFIAALIICYVICLVAGRLRSLALQNYRQLEQMKVDRQQVDDVLQNIPDAFCAVDDNWTLLQTNHAFESLVSGNGVGGGRDRSILGKNLREIFPVGSKTLMFEALERCMRERVPQEIEFEDKGAERWFRVMASPTVLGVAAFLQDTTERKELEQNRERMLANERMARGEAEQAGRLKEEFLAILSHELRTPMTSLVGWSSMLNRPDVSPERLEEGLASIERSARAQAKMVEDILDISRISAGKMLIELEFVILSEVIEAAMAPHAAAAAAKGIRMEFIDESPNLVVRCDSSRLHQVFSNLISNAIKFSPKGAYVKISCVRVDSNACCVVEDHGEGISPEFLPYIFERFRQANATTSRRHGGLGLGLAIAKQLIELQGGTLEAKSDGEGKGSTFTVCIPIAAQLPEQVDAKGGCYPHESLEGVRVLLVEDDESTRVLLTRVLEEQEAIICATPEAESALEALKEFRPDIILSDIGLPTIDGYALMKMIRSREDGFKSTPAVALTAFARPTDRKSAIEAGYNAFQTKPVNASSLIRTLIRLAGRTEKPS